MSSYHVIIKSISALRSKNISLTLYHLKNRRNRREIFQPSLCTLFLAEGHTEVTLQYRVGENCRIKHVSVRSQISFLGPSSPQAPLASVTCAVRPNTELRYCTRSFITGGQCHCDLQSQKIFFFQDNFSPQKPYYLWLGLDYYQCSFKE